MSLWGEDVQVDAATWGRIPGTYLRFSEDRTTPVERQDKMIAEADALTPDNRFSVHGVAAPHVGPLDRPEIVRVFTDLAEPSTG